ncbi:MAG: hypothetical protein WCI51_19225, partial [Lentisphaerota bacterium]
EAKLKYTLTTKFTKKHEKEPIRFHSALRNESVLVDFFRVSFALQYAYTASVCFLESTPKPSH